MDLSTLMGAVKPKERTDQYVILAALFAVEAHLAPVTAKQITDVIKTTPGNKDSTERKCESSQIHGLR
jgi:hypothetical protein